MKKRTGFANPEYLLTLAAVLVVLSIVIPQFARFRQRTRTFKALSALRAASARYAADAKTKGPRELTDLTKDGRYLKEIPPAEIYGRHSRSNQVRPLGQTDDSGGWTHANWPGSPREGDVWINCTHTDAKGSAWSAY